MRLAHTTPLLVLATLVATVAGTSGASAKPPATSRAPIVTVSAAPAEVTAADATVTLTVTVNRQAKSVRSCVVTGAMGGPSCGTVTESSKKSTTFALAVTGSAWTEGANEVAVQVVLTDGGMGEGSATVTATLGDDWSAYVGCYAVGSVMSYDYVGPKNTFGNAPMHWNGDCSGDPAEGIWGTNTFVEAASQMEADAICNALDPSNPYFAAALVSVGLGFPGANAWTCII